MQNSIDFFKNLSASYQFQALVCDINSPIDFHHDVLALFHQAHLELGGLPNEETVTFGEKTLND